MAVFTGLAAHGTDESGGEQAGEWTAHPLWCPSVAPRGGIVLSARLLALL